MSYASNRRTAIRRLLGDPSGASALEFAFVLPILVFLLIGTAEIGRYYFTVHSVRTMVADAARKAMLNTSIKSPTAMSGTTCDNSFKITDTNVLANLAGNSPFLNLSQLTVCINNSTTSGVRTVVVRAKYPFSSPLPFLSQLGEITDQTVLFFRA